MDERDLVLVVRDATYGSAAMRGLQMAANLLDVGVPCRVLRATADRASLLDLRDTTVVLVKDAVVEDELVLALSIGGNHLVWDVVDYPAHKPPLAGAESPAEHVRGLAASECVRQLLVMTDSGGTELASAFRHLESISRVDHQVARGLLALEEVPAPEALGIGYLGAPENVPRWVPDLDELRLLLTSERSFPELVPEARRLPVHVDFRDPTRDRRDLKPWTKTATAVWLGAVVIAEATEANVDDVVLVHDSFTEGRSTGASRSMSRSKRSSTRSKLE